LGVVGGFAVSGRELEEIEGLRWFVIIWSRLGGGFGCGGGGGERRGDVDVIFGGNGVVVFGVVGHGGG